MPVSKEEKKEVSKEEKSSVTKYPLNFFDKNSELATPEEIILAAKEFDERKANDEVSDEELI